MTIGNKDMLAFAAWCIGLIALTVLLAGCASLKPSSVQQASSATGETRAYASAIKNNNQLLVPHTDEAGRPLLKSNNYAADQIVGQQDKIDSSTAALAKQLNDVTAKYQKEHNSLWAKIGRWLKWIVGIGLVLWGAVGIGAVVALDFSPAGWLGTFGRWAISNLPFMGVFSFLARRIKANQAAASTINIYQGTPPTGGAS